MEIMEGYKQTDIGILPSHWEITELRNVILQSPQYGIGAAACEYSDELPTYLRITDISENGKFIKSNKASVNHTLSKNYILEDGDLVFSRTGASVGKSYLYNSADGELIYAGFLIKVKPDRTKLLPYFLKLIVSTNTFWNWINMVSMRSGQPGINSIQLKSLKLQIPSITEQVKITEAFSDIDAYISRLEQLIEKKHQIKQGVMQELLKPKQGWQTKRLGEMVEMASGGTPLTSISNYYNGEIPWVVIADITKAGKYISSTEKNISSEGLKNSSAKLFDRGVLLFAMYASIGKCTISKVETTCNQAILGITPKNISLEFLYYHLSFFQKKHASMGQTGTQSNLNKEMVMNLSVPHPSVDEQEKIAKILTDLDDELNSLELKLKKAKSIKLGMMENLLTGKIRLV
jgi:type I restriction enzyme S subunit